MQDPDFVKTLRQQHKFKLFKKRNLRLSPNKLLFLTGFIGIILILTVFFTEHCKYIPQLLFIGFGSVLGGSIIGFLFGFPKTLKTNEDGRSNLKLNSNLEDIIDWLTKIIVGVSLTQIFTINVKIKALLNFISEDLNGFPQSIILFLIIYFFIYGFYFGYLTSSLHLKSLLDDKYYNAENFIKDIEDELEKYYGTGKAFNINSVAGVNKNFMFDKLKVLKMLDYLERKNEYISPNAYRNIGLEFFKQHDYNTANELFRKSANIDKNSVALSNIAITTANHLGQPKLGLRILLDATFLHPEDAMLQYNLGCQYSRNKDSSKAVKHLSKALELEPTYLEFAKSDKAWHNIKDNPEFTKIVSEYDPIY